MTAKEARAISNNANERIAKKHVELAETLCHLFMRMIQTAADSGLFNTTIYYNGMVELTRDYKHLFTDGVTMSSFLTYMAEYLKNFGYGTTVCRDQCNVVTAIHVAW